MQEVYKALKEPKDIWNEDASLEWVSAYHQQKTILFLDISLWCFL